MKNEERILSEKEKKRLERFEKICEEMKQQEYSQKNLTIDINKATILSVGLMLILFSVGSVIFYAVNRKFDFFNFQVLPFFVSFVILIFIHEMIHGACWVIFAPGSFKDIEFGIMKPSFSPYCTCLVPVKKWQYLVGVMMPGLVLGVIPFIVSILMANQVVMFMSCAMIAVAAGDMMIFRNIARYKSRAKDIVYIDHPTDAGGVIFER
jgi:hypothetical protein